MACSLFLSTTTTRNTKKKQGAKKKSTATSSSSAASRGSGSGSTRGRGRGRGRGGTVGDSARVRSVSESPPPRRPSAGDADDFAAAIAELKRVKEECRDRADAREARKEAECQRIDAAHQRIDAEHQRIDGLEENFENYREENNERVGHLETMFDSQQDQLGRLEDRVDNQEDQSNNQQDQIHGFTRQNERRFRALQDQILLLLGANTDGATGGNGNGTGAGNEGASAAAGGGANAGGGRGWLSLLIGVITGSVVAARMADNLGLRGWTALFSAVLGGIFGHYLFPFALGLVRAFAFPAITLIFTYFVHHREFSNVHFAWWLWWGLVCFVFYLCRRIFQHPAPEEGQGDSEEKGQEQKKKEE